MRRKAIDMSVGNVAQSVWSVSRRSAAVDWDKQQQQEEQSEQTNQYSTQPTNELVTTRPRVSRSLFGPSDPQENRRMAAEETNSKRFSDRNRWNFDFYREKPTSGRFDWTQVSVTNSNSNESKKSFGESGVQTESLWSKKKSAKS